MSYYEDRIKALEARIEEMAMLNRMKAVSVEASLMILIGELNDENARLKAEVERLTKAGDAFYESEIGYYGEQILNDPKHHTGQLCRDWNAAKEGKQL